MCGEEQSVLDTARPGPSSGVSASRNVRRIGHVDCPGGGQVWVEGTTLYVGHMQAPSGTSIVDVADPRRPKVLNVIGLPAGWHSHKVRVSGDIMIVNHERLGQEGDPADRVERSQSAERAGEIDQQLQEDFGRTMVDVVLDHHLQPEPRMPEQADREQRQRDRVRGFRQCGLHLRVIGTGQRHQHAENPRRQHREEDGGDALPPEVTGAGLRRAQTVGAAHRGAVIADGGFAHAPPRIAKNQIAAVKTKVKATTV